jgi:hypothetical protein
MFTMLVVPIVEGYRGVKGKANQKDKKFAKTHFKYIFDVCSILHWLSILKLINFYTSSKELINQQKFPFSFLMLDLLEWKKLKKRI